MPNGLDPAAAQTFVRVISQLGAVGALIVISLWLVYSITSEAEARALERSEILSEISQVETRQMLHTDRMLLRHREVMALLRLICSNTATDSQQRAACISGTETTGP